MLTPDLLVLCYHAVSTTWPASLSVTPASLRRQLERLVRRGYRGSTFTKAVLERPRQPTLCVTFDDAYASVLTEALPLLDELGLPGTVFAPSAYIGRSEPMAWPGIDGWLDTQHRNELTPMRWDGLALLRERGWEVGSHTHTHPRLTALGDDELEHELLESKRELESRLGAACTSLAYPYGDQDARVVEAARRAGYAAAGSLPTRFDPPTALAWPRLGVYHKDGVVIFILKVSRVVRSLRRTAGWDLAHRAARTLR
jgi:peptidoglycan/xylan/chitin deacetylase (PgdA/CDA1 family)